MASTPPGADVMLDGKRVGKTPFTIHKLDLTKSHALEVKRAAVRDAVAVDQRHRRVRVQG